MTLVAPPKKKKGYLAIRKRDREAHRRNREENCRKSRDAYRRKREAILARSEPVTMRSIPGALDPEALTFPKSRPPPKKKRGYRYIIRKPGKTYRRRCEANVAGSESVIIGPIPGTLDPEALTLPRSSLSSFDWRVYLRKPKFIAAPVSCFKHVALHDCWDEITADVFVEIRSPDCKTCCTTNPCRFWIASVVKVAGYMGLLQYEGFDQYCGQKWISLCTEPHIHPIGWCSENKKLLVPPKSIEDERDDWKTFLTGKIAGCRTIPPNFGFKMIEHSNNLIKEGMKLEVVDKNLISVVRSAEVGQVVGGRLHVVYLDSESNEYEGFWCHERSPLIHPVGWAQIIGHALKGKPDYARESLQKTLYRTFEPNDATWDMFLPVINPVRELKFKKGMKLEAIDPLNLSTICVATVTEVLRNNYLMIGIDGMMADNGSDCFCYHASSPCIFPVGFSEDHDIELTPPRGYKSDFRWSEYLKKTKSAAAPVDLFHRDIPNHGFKENMYLEAVDLMEPRLICVAYITQVVGRLLRVHFEGWEDDYDQWCDCESPDLFPVGWCDVLGYRLEAPRIDPNADEKKKKPGKKKRRRLRSKKFGDDYDSVEEVLPEPTKRKAANGVGV